MDFRFAIEDRDMTRPPMVALPSGLLKAIHDCRPEVKIRFVPYLPEGSFYVVDLAAWQDLVSWGHVTGRRERKQP